jgi:uncharacterized protein (TIGR02271 family)
LRNTEADLETACDFHHPATHQQDESASDLIPQEKIDTLEHSFMAETFPAGSGTTLIAFFPKYSDALSAISELKDAGFTSSEIGLASSSSSSQVLNQANTGIDSGTGTESRLHTDERGAWDKVKDFFTGQDESYRGDDDDSYNDTFRHLSVTGDRARYYSTGIQSGGAVVTVRADAGRLEEAREILTDNDGDLRTTGFDAIGAETRRPATGSSMRSENADRSIQLRGEVLRAVKERVQKGEIRLRKDLVTENRTINVPVTREEVIVERVDASGTVPDTESLGDQQEVRIPVSEERVNVTKDKVVTGQVRVQKRTVQDTQQVSGDVQHEELRVDREGDVDVTDQSNVADKGNVSEPRKPIRKKPAA